MATPRRVIVTAPTGRIGGLVAADLTRSEVEVSVLVRGSSLDRLDPELRSHATIYQGELHDDIALIAASAGADAMLLILPTDLSTESLPELWRSFTRAAVAAITAQNIGHVVLVSSKGADVGGAELLNVLQEAEQRVQDAAPHVRVLRPGYFMENLLLDVEALAEGTLPMTAGPDTPLHMIAIRDIAALASELLGDLSWRGHLALALDGPEVLTPAQAAEVIAQAIGRSVRYEPVTAEAFLSEFLAYGIHPGTAQPLAEMFSLSLPDAPELPSAERGHTPTTLREFVRDILAPAVQARMASTA